jgi:hypothetical protein
MPAYKEVIDKTIGKDFTHFKTVQRYDTEDYFIKNNTPNCVVPKHIAEEYPGNIAEGEPCSNLEVYYRLIHGVVYAPKTKKIPGCDSLSGTLSTTSFNKNDFENVTYKKATLSCSNAKPEKEFLFFKNS